MIRSLLFTDITEPHRPIQLVDVPVALQDQNNLVWIDLRAPSEEEVYLVMRDLFHFHPLAIEDCLSAGQAPKIDDFGSYIFIVAQALDRDQAVPYLFSRQVNFFLGANYLVTSSLKEKNSPVDTVWERLNRDERLLNNGSDFLCHSILDVLVDEYLPLLEELEEEIEALEERVIFRPTQANIERLLMLKHSTLALHRLASPLREITNRLSRDPFPMIDLQSRIYFRDVYDHVVRIESNINLVREMITSAQDMYINATSMRTNEVMRVLTLVATIFLPLTFVAGVYGMNFVYQPEFNWRYGYLFVWSIFITLAAIMLIIFKRKKWF